MPLAVSTSSLRSIRLQLLQAVADALECIGDAAAALEAHQDGRGEQREAFDLEPFFRGANRFGERPAVACIRARSAAVRSPAARAFRCRPIPSPWASDKPARLVFGKRDRGRHHLIAQQGTAACGS